MSDFFTKLIQSGQFVVENGCLKILGEYMLILPSGVAVHLYDELVKELGRRKAGIFMEEMGRFQVEAAAKRYIKRYNFKNLPKTKIEEFTLQVLNSVGWGDIEIVALNPAKATAQVLVKGGAFPTKWLLMNGKSSRPIDFWLKGMIREHFTVIFGSKMKVVEKKCLACGDPYCLFEVSKA
jgi:hypothetical protein